MKRSFSSYDLLWLSIALFPLLMLAMLFPVQPHDYWWYLRLGRDILEQSAVPLTDTYSSIQAGQPVVYLAWLSSVILWLVYQSGGISLTVLLVAIFIGLTYTLLWKLLREYGLGPRLASLLTLLAGLSGSNNWGVRPQLLLFPLFLATLWLLLKWHKCEKKFPWALILIGWAWANLHGSFTLFFVLTGTAFLFGSGDKKSLFIILLASFLLTFINPNTFGLWRSTLETFVSPITNDLVTEWAPPVNSGWQMNIYFLWLLALIPLAIFSQKRPSFFEIALFLVFTWLGLRSQRFVIWDLFMLSMFTASLMPTTLVQKIDQTVEVKTASLNIGLGVALLVMPLMLLPGIREKISTQNYPAVEPHTPIAATDWLSEHPELPGVMWNDVIYGSYLVHALPSRPVWLDTRIQMSFTLDQMKEYLFVQSAQPGWDVFLAEHDVNLLFLAKTQTSLVPAVQNSTDWCKQYEDEISLIYSRCSTLP